MLPRHVFGQPSCRSMRTTSGSLGNGADPLATFGLDGSPLSSPRSGRPVAAAAATTTAAAPATITRLRPRLSRGGPEEPGGGPAGGRAPGPDGMVGDSRGEAEATVAGWESSGLVPPDAYVAGPPDAWVAGPRDACVAGPREPWS